MRKKFWPLKLILYIVRVKSSQMIASVKTAITGAISGE